MRADWGTSVRTVGSKNCPAPFVRLPPFVEFEAGRRQHETRVDAIIAGRDAAAGAGARVCPTGAAACRITAAAEDIQHIADDHAGLTGIDPRRRSGRADLDAFRAAGAAVKDVAYPCIDRGDECVSVIGHNFPLFAASILGATPNLSIIYTIDIRII